MLTRRSGSSFELKWDGFRAIGSTEDGGRRSATSTRGAHRRPRCSRRAASRSRSAQPLVDHSCPQFGAHRCRLPATPAADREAVLGRDDCAEPVPLELEGRARAASQHRSGRLGAREPPGDRGARARGGRLELGLGKNCEAICNRLTALPRPPTSVRLSRDEQWIYGDARHDVSHVVDPNAGVFEPGQLIT
jgi:hypothetical protein